MTVRTLKKMFLFQILEEFPYLNSTWKNAMENVSKLIIEIIISAAELTLQ